MKKITTTVFLLCACFSAWSQLSFEASSNYGKLEAITYDMTTANKMYAATQGNHIVVSNDNGATWSLFYSYPGSDFITDMRLLPGNGGLSFSTMAAVHFLDLGTQTITHTFPVPQNNVPGAGNSYVSSYSVFDAAGTVMIVDTGFSVGFGSQGKTFYTANGGDDWTEVYYTVDNDNVFINSVAICPNDSKKLFLMRGLGDTDVDGGLWISKDNGDNWTEHLPGIPFEAIAFNPANLDDVFLGTSISFGDVPEALYRSADQGDNWDEIDVTFTNETLDNITSIVFNPVNPSEMIMLDENEILRSANGGATWSSTVYPVGISMDYYYGITASFNPFNSGQIAITTDFFPQSTSNGGGTLAQITAKFYNIISTSVAKYGDDVHLYYGSRGGRLHKNITSGETSENDIEGPDSFNPKRNYMFADPTIPGRVFTYASMGFFGGNVNVSTDYGVTTTNIMQGFGDDVQELTIDPNNSNIIYVSMRSGEGGTVTKLDISDLGDVIATDIVTPEVSEFGDGVVTGIVINPADSDEIYISKRTKVFKSVNGGDTWQEKTDGLEAIVSGADLIWDMAVNPLNPAQMTLCSNAGIFTTTDFAENWELVHPGGNVKRIKHSPANNGVIVGSTFAHENGLSAISYSVDSGANWTTVSEEDLNHIQAYSMDYDFDGDKIHAYIGTTDLGVVKYTITDLQLGVNHPSLESSIGIYPNPATGIVTIDAGIGIAIESVAIYSMTGQKVLETNATSLDVSALSNGIYVVKVTTGTGKSLSQKLVKE